MHLCFDWLRINVGGSQHRITFPVQFPFIIAKAFVSVVTLRFLVIFKIIGMSNSRNLCSGAKRKREANLWGVVIDLFIRSSSELSFSGLAKQVNSYEQV